MSFNSIRAKPFQKVIVSPKSTLTNQVFIRPHLNNEDVLYDEYSNIIFFSKTESGPYNVAFAIRGVFRSSS